jgi:hypothetical protein
MKVLFQYIRDLPGCLRNGKLGSDSGPLAVANIRDHCTSGVTPKADVQDFGLKVRKVSRPTEAGYGSANIDPKQTHSWSER